MCFASEISLHLLQRSWVQSTSGGSFQAALSAARKKISVHSVSARGGVVVAERDPIDFSAAFFGAMMEGLPVLLANPSWQTREWEQLYCWLPDPVLFLGPAPERPRMSADHVAAKLMPGQLYIATGGSSGNLKFARFSWSQLVAACQSFFQLWGTSLTHTVCILPLYHVSGLMQLIRAYYQQGTIEFTELKQLQGLQTPYRLSLVPTQLQRIFAQPALLETIKRSAKMIFVGGAAIDSNLEQRIEAEALPVQLCYGMTETAAMIAVRCLQVRKDESAVAGFELMPDVQVAIRPMPSQVSGVGQICIRSQRLFSGYHNTDQQGVIDTYGSDDFGFLDADGRLHIMGRIDGLVNTGGEKVNVLEVQACLQQTGLVQAALVSAIPDSEWGQKLVALYTPSHPEVNSASLKQALAERLVDYKLPKIWMELSVLPLDEKGKVQPTRLQAILDQLS
jgi:O-succinylbenzoic acid--CoA ligase